MTGSDPFTLEEFKDAPFGRGRLAKAWEERPQDVLSLLRRHTQHVIVDLKAAETRIRQLEQENEALRRDDETLEEIVEEYHP